MEQEASCQGEPRAPTQPGHSWRVLGSWGRQQPAGVLFCRLGSQPWAQGDGNCFSLLVLGRDRDGKPLSESMLGTLIYYWGHAAPTPPSLHAPSPAKHLSFWVCRFRSHMSHGKSWIRPEGPSDPSMVLRSMVQLTKDISLPRLLCLGAVPC